MRSASTAAASGATGPPVASGGSGLALRVASALALIPVALGLVILGAWPFAFLVGLAVVLMALEWRQLTMALGPGGGLAGVSVAALGLVVVVLAAAGHADAALVALLVGALAAGAIARRLAAPPLWIGLGAAYLAGLAVGYWPDAAVLERQWQLDRRFDPELPAAQADALKSRWHEAVARSRGWVRTPSRGEG